MISISSDSDFASLAGTVSKHIESLNSAGQSLSSSCDIIKSGLSSVSLGSWNDSASALVEQYRASLIAGMDAINGDLSGTYQGILAATSDLVTLLTNCNVYKTNIEGATSEYNRIPVKIKDPYDSTGKTKIPNPRRAELNNIIDDNKRNLDACIDSCKSVLNAIGAIQFSGQVTYTSSNPGTAQLITINPDDGGNGDGENGSFAQYGTNGKVQKTTYQVTDPETGETINMNLLVNPSNGNIAYGNDDIGYFFTCIAENGTIYSGTSTENSNSLDGAARVISDNHENHPNSSIFDTYSEQTYGLDKSHTDVNPVWSLNPSWGNCQYATMNVGGQDVTVVLPYSENVAFPYSPASLCNMQNNSNDSGDSSESYGGDSSEFDGGGASHGF